MRIIDIIKGSKDGIFTDCKIKHPIEPPDFSKLYDFKIEINNNVIFERTVRVQEYVAMLLEIDKKELDVKTTDKVRFITQELLN